MKLKEPQPVAPIPISSFILHRKDYEVDPTYQRAPGIWEKWMEQYLIDTILRGYSIPVIFLHKKGGKKFIVDGQQRLKTIWKFYDNNLELSEKYSSDIIKENNGAKKYSKLLPEYQDRFDKYTLPTSFLEDYKDEEIRSTFKRLQTGKALTPGEKLNAFPGQIVPIMRELGNHVFFKEIVGFGVQRYKNYKLAATFLFLEKEGSKSINVTYIYEFFENNPNLDKSSSVYKNVKKVLNYLKRTFKNRTGELSNQAWAVSIYLLTSYLLEKYVMKDQCENLKNFIIDFYQKIAKVVSTGGPELIKFNNAVSRGTTSEENIKYRFSLMIKSFIEEYHPQELDEDRIFDRNQKLEIYRKYNGICQKCGKRLKFGETSTHYHHIDPYILGGLTEVERGLLVCRDCHLKKIHGVS